MSLDIGIEIDLMRVMNLKYFEGFLWALKHVSIYPKFGLDQKGVDQNVDQKGAFIRIFLVRVYNKSLYDPNDYYSLLRSRARHK